jgi:hypothetical protein
MAIMENTVNKTFTQGIYDTMSIMVGNKQHERVSALNNMIASFLPNILNQLNGDELMRETRTLMDALMARSHLYNGVDPKRNVLGEPVIRTLPKYDPLGVVSDDTREIDPVMEEITRLGILNQSTADNPGRRVPGPSRIDLSTIPHTEGQSLYDKWIELTGEVKIGGKTLREQLAETFESRSYRTAPDGFIGSSSNTKGEIVRKIIRSYREKAKGELPELVRIIQEERRLGGAILRGQADENRGQLFDFPSSTETAPVTRPRTFEDLMNQQ